VEEEDHMIMILGESWDKLNKLSQLEEKRRG
jgi:hypothetical protein